MGGTKYPLDLLLRVRRDRVDGAAHSLAIAIEAQTIAERARSRAEAARVAAERDAGALRRNEFAKLESGSAQAGNLVQLAAWDAKEREVATMLERDAQVASQHEAMATNATIEARGELALRTAERGLVERHRDRWDAAKRAASERIDEEGATEAWAAKGTGGTG